MSAQPIDFFFEFSSPYGYIAACLAEDFERRVGRPVRWRPILLGPIFKLTGQAPLVDIPLKGDYAKRDFLRTARLHGVPFNFPSKFPIGTAAAMRAFYRVDDSDPGKARQLARALYQAYFVDGTDISGAETVLAIAKQAGVDATALAAALEDPALKDRGRKEVEAAIAKGVFGSPYFIVDGEPFWGVDRMPMAEEWARRGGW